MYNINLALVVLSEKKCSLFTERKRKIRFVGRCPSFRINAVSLFFSTTVRMVGPFFPFPSQPPNTSLSYEVIFGSYASSSYCFRWPKRLSGFGNNISLIRHDHKEKESIFSNPCFFSPRVFLKQIIAYVKK